MYTVAELFPLIKSQAGSAGVCSEDELMEKMNVIGPEILDRIEAKGTVSNWCLNICGGCVVLPADLETPLQAWLCGTALGFRGEYWLGRLAGDIPYDLDQEVPWKEIVMDGRYAHTQVHPIPACSNDAFEFVARSQKDAGKVVSIRYRNTMGREVEYTTTLRGDREGSDPSDTGIGEVTFVSKPRTAGAVELWMRNLRSGHRFLVAVYDAADEHPEYRIVHITGCANGRLVIKGRKRWMPLRTDKDVVPFGKVAVWRAALIAESHLANRELEAYEGTLQRAVNMLDQELTALRPKGTAEIVDFITPYTIQNRSPLRRR
jgi:hypothetical protein